MKPIFRTVSLALAILASSGCSGSTSVLPAPTQDIAETEALQIAAKACGCKVSAGGTFTEDNTGDRVRFRISGSGTGNDPDSFADFAAGTATFTNLTTGRKDKIAFNHIECHPTFDPTRVTLYVFDSASGDNVALRVDLTEDQSGVVDTLFVTPRDGVGLYPQYAFTLPLGTIKSTDLAACL